MRNFFFAKQGKLYKAYEMVNLLQSKKKAKPRHGISNYFLFNKFILSSANASFPLVF